MDNLVLILVVLVIVAAGVVAAVVYQRRRSARLRAHFGPEYERLLAAGHSRSETEAALEARARRVESLQLRELPPGERQRITDAWRAVQARFADDPRRAVGEADRLLEQTMQALGYPVGDVERCAADLSVHHPALVDDYRVAHHIKLRAADGQSSTEDLRKATMAYRALIGALLQGRIEQGRIEEEHRHDRVA